MSDVQLRDLVVFEMANNHQGDVEHGRRIVREMAALAERHDVRAAVKLQFRDLDTFLHKAHAKGSDRKHVDRFLSTRLTDAEQVALLDEIRACGLVAMCTPFDEVSVARVRDLRFDILKIGSCSARDWPLLEAAATTGLPLVCSTGGTTLDDIDNLASFLEHRGCRFAFMHCVAVYPTPDDRLELNQLDVLRARYPGVPVGWSTHEDPSDTAPVHIAVAKGAELFERHVGVPTDRYSLNAYSSAPEQVDRWLAELVRARRMCGHETRPPVDDDERAQLVTLERGVFAARALRAGHVLVDGDVYFAFPRDDGQLASGELRVGTTTTEAIERDAPILSAATRTPEPPAEASLKKAIHRVKALLREAHVALPSAFQLELSHHAGVTRFDEIGAVLITCVQREYMKKIVAQLPGQHHPHHYHRTKEETFQVLHGVLEVDLDGHRHTLRPGDTLLVQPGVFHAFWTQGGCVFEEISTRELEGDSVYRDPAIAAQDRGTRKTVVENWGRFQLPGPVS